MILMFCLLSIGEVGLFCATHRRAFRHSPDSRSHIFSLRHDRCLRRSSWLHLKHEESLNLHCMRTESAFTHFGTSRKCAFWYFRIGFLGTQHSLESTFLRFFEIPGKLKRKRNNLVRATEQTCFSALLLIQFAICDTVTSSYHTEKRMHQMHVMQALLHMVMQSTILQIDKHFAFLWSSKQYFYSLITSEHDSRYNNLITMRFLITNADNVTNCYNNNIIVMREVTKLSTVITIRSNYFD